MLGLLVSTVEEKRGFFYRLRTGHGNGVHFLFLWNLAESTQSDCGDPDQTMEHTGSFMVL